MSEHREEFLLKIETKLLGLTVKELHRVCEYCKIAGKDSENIKNKTCRALVKHIIKFCENEGIPVLLGYYRSYMQDFFHHAKCLYDLLSTDVTPSPGSKSNFELANFNITPKYCPGKMNTDADFLSRTPVSMDSYMSESTEQCSPEVLSAIFNAAETQK